MATLTSEQFQKKIEDKVRSLKTTDIVFDVATSTVDKLRGRVFDKGINGDGSQIGKYSTEPMYASKKVFKGGGFSPQGKNAIKTATGKLKKGSKNKKDGSQRKSMYLSGGYKQLRSVQGMESGFVNLTYYGQLRRGMKLIKEGDTVILKVDGINALKVDGLTDKYGASTFKHNKEEKAFFIKEVQKKLVNYFNS